MQSSLQPLQTDQICFVNIEVKKKSKQQNKEGQGAMCANEGCLLNQGLIRVLVLIFHALKLNVNENS